MKDDETIPTVSCYCVYMSPVLVVRDRTTKAYAARTVSKAGVDQCAMQFFVGFMREQLGWRRNISVSDGAYSLVAWRT